MTDLNSVVIMGNLVKDNQVKEVGNSRLSNFTLAINRSVKKGINGKQKYLILMLLYGIRITFCNT